MPAGAPSLAKELNIDTGGCTRRILNIHGEAGAEWLQRLPETLAGCARRWGLVQVLPPFADLSYHYVAPAVRQDGTPVVLKGRVPCEDLQREAQALRYFNGEGIEYLLDADLEAGFLLLERLLPGTCLKLVGEDAQVTQVAAEVMQRLWRPAPDGHPFATVASWAADLNKLRETFGGGYGPFPPKLVDRSQALFADLLASDTARVLLHGDMHPQNILQAERAPWLAIDPKGVVGSPLYDVATFVSGVSGVFDLERGVPLPAVLKRRVAQLAEILGFEQEAILSWCLAHTVLAGWWTYEDHGGGWEYAFGLAETYTGLLQAL